MMDRIDRIRQSFIPRKAEKSDTGDHILGHEPDYHKNKSKHHHDHDDSNDDMTDISIESLIIFLQGLIKETATAPEKPKPVDQSMKKAISAYGKTPNTTEKRYTYLNDDDALIDADNIHTLIDKLKILIERGYAHITLEQASGFIQSIEKTVEKYLGM